MSPGLIFLRIRIWRDVGDLHCIAKNLGLFAMRRSATNFDPLRSFVSKASGRPLAEIKRAFAYWTHPQRKWPEIDLTCDLLRLDRRRMQEFETDYDATDDGSDSDCLIKRRSSVTRHQIERRGEYGFRDDKLAREANRQPR